MITGMHTEVHTPPRIEYSFLLCMREKKLHNACAYTLRHDHIHPNIIYRHIVLVSVMHAKTNLSDACAYTLKHDSIHPNMIYNFTSTYNVPCTDI